MKDEWRGHGFVLDWQGTSMKLVRKNSGVPSLLAETAKGRSNFFVWLVLLNLGIAAMVVHLGSNEVATRSMAWGLALLIGGVAIAFKGDRRFDMFSPVFFFGISFAVFYGLSAIAPFLMTSRGGYDSMIVQVLPYYPLAAMASFLCLLGFYAGYSNAFAISLGRRSWLLRWDGSPFGRRILWAVLLVMGVCAFVLLVANNAYLQVTTELESPLFYSAVGFIQSGLYFAVSFAVAMALAEGKKFWIWAAWASVLVTLMFGIPSGSKTLSLLAFMLLALALNYARRQFSRKEAALAILAVLAIVMILMPFNAVYRSVLLTAGTTNQSLLGSIESLEEAVDELLDKDMDETMDLAVDYTTSRLSNVSVVANIIRYQDQGGDLHYGESYLRALYGLIPRPIWPEKPGLTIGQEIAVELGYSAPELTRLGQTVSTTSVGITMVGEQIYNFSWVLAPFGMALLGMFYRWAYEVFKRGYQKGLPQLAIGVYACWWYSLVFSANESNFAAVFMGAVKFTIFLLILFVLLKFRRSPLLGRLA